MNQQNMEVKEKYRVSENQATILVEQSWSNLIYLQYDSVKSKMAKKYKENYDAWVKKIDELELIEGLNDSFSEY